MKFTLSWLKEHIETSADLSSIESTLNSIGLEVEKIEDKTIQLSSFKVAKVIDVKKHPDADRLNVCNVKTINGNFQVVCGAPNVELNMMGVFAPVGTYIPGINLNLAKFPNWLLL